MVNSSQSKAVATTDTASNRVLDVDQWAQAANDDSVQQFFTSTLQAMSEANSRELHVEQEAEFCRVRMRINGRLSEQKVYQPALAADLLTLLRTAQPDDQRYIPDAGEFLVPALIDGASCNLTICHYPVPGGYCLTLTIDNPAAIPEVLEQTPLDNHAIQRIREHYQSATGGEVTLVCAHSGELLKALFYALLSEVNSVDRKVIAVQNRQHKSVPRVSQIIGSAGNGHQFLTHIRAASQLSNHIFVDWPTCSDKRTVQSLLQSPPCTLATTPGSLPGNASITLFWLGSAATGLLSLLGHSETLRYRLHTLIEMEEAGLICPHCAESHTPARRDYTRLPTDGSMDSARFFTASGCTRCDETGISALTGLASISRVNDRVREAIGSGSLQATERSVAEAQGKTTIASQLKALVREGKINGEEWLQQQP